MNRPTYPIDELIDELLADLDQPAAPAPEPVVYRTSWDWLRERARQARHRDAGVQLPMPWARVDDDPDREWC